MKHKIKKINSKSWNKWWKKHYPSAYHERDGFIYIDEIIVYYSFN